jgi:pyruvate,water dikinase
MDAPTPRPAAIATARPARDLIVDFADVRRGDVARVGGKTASLGEMIGALAGAGIRVPPGFAITAEGYRLFVGRAGIAAPIRRAIAAYRRKAATLEITGAAIRQMFLDAPFPSELADAIAAAYHALSSDSGVRAASVAVRSSATAEDLPDASFAGQQESFLNVTGEAALIDACRRCFASLYTDRAIAYREAKGFDDARMALSIGVQRMVRSDLAGSGVMFSLDTETGFPRVVSISAAWGLGETVVQGQVDPDTHIVFKPLLDVAGRRPILDSRCGGKTRKLVYARTGGQTALHRTTRAERDAFVLSDDEVLQLARWAVAIEAHYGCPMDMEWAKDGPAGELYLVQARPETVQARRSASRIETWRLTGRAQPVLTGAAVGEAIAVGPVRRLDDAGAVETFPAGAILVTANTDPDWVPIMRRAAGIVTDHGGPTSHAAIVSRELGVPAVIGTGAATTMLEDGETVTLSCAEGEQGHVYRGALPFDRTEVDVGALPATRTRLMVNLADPAGAFHWWRLPAMGVGLARMEFIIANHIRVHPMALVHPDRITDRRVRRTISRLTLRHDDPAEFFVTTLARGIARLAAVFHPHPAIVRLSDFKSNEYRSLLGGADFEPAEENPMLGLRGASRYYHPLYRDAFALECRAVRHARELLGFDNIVVMVPFCRTPAEADRVLAEMHRHGLRRGRDGLKIYVMCEIPSNVILADDFAARFDGFSIGSNDLTQLLLGVDRDSDLLSPLFDERDPAVLRSIADVIRRAHRAGIPVGICGQAPSDHADVAAFLVEHGIDSISLNPDSFVATLRRVARTEGRTPTDPPP